MPSPLPRAPAAANFTRMIPSSGAGRQEAGDAVTHIMPQATPPAGVTGASEFQLDAQDVAFGRPRVLDGVDDGLVPGEGPRLARMAFRRLTLRRHPGLPIREVDAHAVRVAVARFDLARREMDVEDA